jgi:hypothetical protein
MASALMRLLILSALAGLVLAAAPPRVDLDTAFERFWTAKDPDGALKAAREIERSGAAFDDVLQRLRRGRSYQRGVPTGIIPRTRQGFEYALDVPASYDPARPYPVRIHLHGGVMREVTTPRAPRGIGSLAGVADQIYVLPIGSPAAPWWSRTQVANLRAILDSVKRTYNVDENRVVVSGVSDGGTGAFYVAMADTTPYSAFIPLNGFLMVLRNEPVVEGEQFPNNLRSKPLFVVNGGRDRLYPTSVVEPILTHLNRGGVVMNYVPQPEAGHETSWWPQLRARVDDFIREHPREPLPDRVSWETGDPRRSGRAHWLVIDELGTTPVDARDLPDLNEFDPPAGGRGLLFARSRAHGRVDLVRHGNDVEASTSGVRRFILLLSTDQFDFSQPVRVQINGQPAFDERVTPSMGTLLKWAARDNDRTMLFAGEISLVVR